MHIIYTQRAYGALQVVSCELTDGIAPLKCCTQIGEMMIVDFFHSIEKVVLPIVQKCYNMQEFISFYLPVRRHAVKVSATAKSTEIQAGFPLGQLCLWECEMKPEVLMPLALLVACGFSSSVSAF